MFEVPQQNTIAPAAVAGEAKANLA